MIFNLGEGLLRSASQDSRMSIERTRAGWNIIGAIMSLGSSVVKGIYYFSDNYLYNWEKSETFHNSIQMLISNVC